MNKKIISLFAFVFSAILFAGPKADLEKANKLISENKQEEAIKLLEKTEPVKGEESEYEQINYALGLNYVEIGDEKNAEKYLKKVSDNVNSKTEIAKNADKYLILLAKEKNLKIEYLERLSKRFDNKDPEIIAELNAHYVLNKLDKKASSLNSLIKEQGENFSDIVDLITAQILVTENYDLANTYIKRALKSKNTKIVAEVHFMLANYNLSIKNEKKAIEEIALAEKIDPSNAVLLARIGGLYKSMDQEDKNFEYLKKAYKLDSKQLPIVLELIESSFDRNNKKDLNVWSSIARNFDKTVTDAELSKIFMKKNRKDLAKEFAISANKKGDKSVNYLLFALYLDEYNKEEILKIGEDILKNGSAEEIETVKAVLNEPDLTLSKVALVNGNLNKALSYAKESAKKNKNAYLMLAHIYIKLGDLSEAKNYLNLSIKNNVNVDESKTILKQLENK